jgi:predicted membrane GTPase involved in stress response
MEIENEEGYRSGASAFPVEYEGLTINVIDTPVHADFYGEVERSFAASTALFS